MSSYLILLPSSFTLFLRHLIFVSEFIRATVPSLHGGVHFKLTHVHLYVWISMPTYALYLKKADEWLLYFLWYFVLDQSLFSTLLTSGAGLSCVCEFGLWCYRLHFFLESPVISQVLQKQDNQAVLISINFGFPKAFLLKY